MYEQAYKCAIYRDIRLNIINVIKFQFKAAKAGLDANAKSRLIANGCLIVEKVVVAYAEEVS